MNGQTLSLRRRVYNRGMRALMWLCAGLTCALLVFLIGYIFCRGIPGLTWELLSGQTSYIKNTIGILPNIFNTLYIILVAMVIVLPLGVGAAIYLTEYAENRRLVSLIEFAAETLTGIPSIIFGLVGMLFFVQKMNLQAGVLAGGLTLVVMILPTILRTTQESLKTVPQSYREGALGLGAGKWRMVRTVVLPNAIDGIVTGCILAVGRIVGESAALLYTAGFGLVLNDFFTALHSSSATLTVARDLRQISAALKMITDMERIGDQAEDIAEIVAFLDGRQAENDALLKEMAKAVIQMVTESVDAYVKCDIMLAKKVIAADDVVDEQFARVKQSLIGKIAADPADGEYALDLLMIAKYYERIGDHATNIAEWVIYSVTGTHKDEITLT